MGCERDFWAWALDRWQTPGIEGQLLMLQDDHGLVILELLFLAWLGNAGVALSANQWRTMVDKADPWVEGVVRPLRAQRQVWRDSEDTTALRQSLGVVELAAEYELAKIYQSLAPDLEMINEMGESMNALVHNLALGLDRADPPVDVVTTGNLADLLADGSPPKV